MKQIKLKTILLVLLSIVGTKIVAGDIKTKNTSMDNTRLMKVVVKMTGRDISKTSFTNRVLTTVFYIRTTYNSSKDIIITHYINGNQLISFKEAFVGDKTLSDDKLMTSTYLVSSHIDSTAPLMHADTYWHIFGQHGCPMPRFANHVGMTSADVGSEWIDQLSRRYNVGFVNDDWIYLVPIMYQDTKGHWVRDWKNSVFSAAITSLTHVSGGSYTTEITSISNYGQVQLRPVMSCNTRKWSIDGIEITEPGTYYCNEFKVSEAATGYDPATITDWFGANGNNVDLTGAQPMAEFTFEYSYKGAQCCVNTSINILREVECQSYGAIQQQFFFDNGDYKAMFMIPKAKERNGVEIDKPFNSPTANSPSYQVYRTSAHLKDVDDPVDRQIGFLYNPNTGDFLVGMAAGLSLVSGETVKSKRIQNCPIGNTNGHWSLLNFSPSNTNKFYIAAINTAPYADNDYFLPSGYSKEINYYVSYFDPAENVGQVYWYKDGDSYIIYAHCQEEHHNQAVNVPDIMEGASLSVVEKTDDTELLSETIQDGKFYVSYITSDANYIVLTATINKYKLIYLVDGEEYKSSEIEYGSAITAEAEPTKEGYTFSGWSEIPETMPAHDVTVTGTFAINKYKLIYQVDGEEYKSSEVEYGSAITAEAEPTKEGYTFSGWSEIPETMPAHDVTVTGTFAINKYKLIYQVDGEEYKSSEIEYGSYITPEAEPTKEGYTFSGWSEVPETMPAHDVIVTGTFIVNQYTITYMIDDEVYQTESVDYGSTITPPEAPEREGYTFEWTDVPETMPAHDITIVGSYTSGISTIKADDEDVKWYPLDGKQIEQPHKGLNIVRMSNGKTKKVLVK